MTKWYAMVMHRQASVLEGANGPTNLAMFVLPTTVEAPAIPKDAIMLGIRPTKVQAIETAIDYLRAERAVALQGRAVVR
jgi:hypothetical protein